MALPVIRFSECNCWVQPASCKCAACQELCKVRCERDLYYTRGGV